MNFLELLVELGAVVVGILLVATNILLLHPFPAPVGRIKEGTVAPAPKGVIPAESSLHLVTFAAVTQWRNPTSRRV